MWQQYLDDNHDRFLNEYFDLVRIPSVSALPSHAADVEKAAGWTADRLKAAGVENVEIMPTGGHPVVYGDWLHAAGKPTLMIYGHFDVQPIDPIELWDTPPFEPTLKEDGRIYARGASDDKGGMVTPIFAVEALLQTTGELPCNVKFCFEGQEEIGSPQLPAFMAQHKEKFACDLVASADGLQWSETEPMLVVALKGLCSIEITVRGPSSDLHSGLHGGVIQNPLEALSNIIASLRTADGKIAVDGFFDNVVDLTADDRVKIAEVPFDAQAYKDQLGVDDFYGEPGYTTRERNWARPTLEINGMWGGFQGDGTKTVIPSEAHAKITCRLVANQNPHKIVEKLIAHVEKHAPVGVDVEARPGNGVAQPFLMASDHPANAMAAEVLTELYGTPPYHVRVGGSVPVIPMFQSELGAETINFGWSLGDEMLHAPNEFFRLASLARGMRGYCLLLERFATYQP